MKQIAFSFAFFCFCIIPAVSQHLYDARQSVLIQAVVQENPPLITLNWVRDTANGGYTIWRKSKYDKIWTDSLVSLSPASITWTDSTIEAGRGYEYQIIKSLPAFPYGNGRPNFGTGFIYAGINIPPVHHSGASLVVIDSSYKQSLASEITRLLMDMEADGWKVESAYVSRNISVQVVKDRIRNWKIQQRDSNLTVFLLGRIPVPYSGNIVPDGHHADHKGAWPCDGYYADMDGVWTDQSVNTNIPPGSRNDNLPGDGKFDNDVIPAPVRIQIGRVDFANMTKFTESEEQLLRRYLNKDHQWRRGLLQANERALVDNNFRDIEGLGSVGWKNFTPMFGFSQVKDLPFRQTLSTQSYLWSYGCGGGGPESASDISSTTNFTNDSLLTIFTMLFGSYFGDWDYPNNFLRAAIASRTCLASTWGNRPSWLFHHMALGEHIGYAAQLTMNNRGLYEPPFYGGYASAALLGDPTIRMYNHPPVENLQAKQLGLHVQLDWQKPLNSLGYFVYKKTAGDSVYILLNQRPITVETYVDSCAGNGQMQYMIRSLELRTTASGTFYNLSSGVIVPIQIDPTAFYAVADFMPTVYFDLLTLKNNSANAISFVWDFGDGTQSSEKQVTHLYNQEGSYKLCLRAFDGCFTDTTCQFVNVISSLPKVEARIQDVLCFGGTTGSILLQISGGTASQNINWLNSTDTGRLFQNLSAGSYNCIITSETGQSAQFGPFLVNQAPRWNLNPFIQPTDPGAPNGFISLNPQGGCPPYRFSWNTGHTTEFINNLSQGIYCVTITDCQLCADTFCTEIKLRTHLGDAEDFKKTRIFPNPAYDHINVALEFEKEQNIKLLLCDAQGKSMAEYPMNRKEKQLKLDLALLPPGSYWIKLEDDHGWIWLPFTKLGN